MDVRLPDGTVVRGVPEGTTKVQLAQKLSKAGIPVPREMQEAAMREATGTGSPNPITQAIGGPAVHMGSELAGSIVGGVAGLARGAGAAAGALEEGQGVGKAIDAGTSEAADTIGRVSKAMTIEPKTPIERGASKVVGYPFEKLAQGADFVGQHTATTVQHVAQALGVSKEVATRIAAAAGATVNTGVQSLPALLGIKGGRGAEAGEGAGAEAGMRAEGAPRSPPSSVGEGPVPRETPPGPGTAPGAPGAAGAKPATATPETPATQRAKAYAARVGLDWTRLGVGTRKALESVAQDATALEKLDPAALRRQAALEQLRIPVRATRGQLTREPVQLRNEALASNTTQGQPIRDVDIAANRDLQANLEALRGRTAGRRGTLEEPVTEEGTENPASIRGATKGPSEVGESVQNAASAKAKWSKKGYQALYKIARETEPDARAPVAPLHELLASNPEIQHLGWVQGWLSKAEKVTPREVDAEGNPEPLKDVTLNELHDLRSKATDIARTGGKEGHYAGQVVKAIDQAMESVPAGAKAWKRANEAFKKHKQEFAEQPLVRDLTESKKGSSARRVALEQTWKKVATGPLEQLREVKRSLTTGGTPETRMAGRRAWRDLRAETVNRILEDARNVTSADETERAVLTEAALRRSIGRIPRANLEELLGARNVRELHQILRARRITTRSPVGGRTTQSGTVPNALTLIERVLHVPGLRHVLGAKEGIKQLGEKGEMARAARQATLSPLEQAARDVERARESLARRRRMQDLENPQGPPAGAPGEPTIGDALRQRPPP